VVGNSTWSRCCRRADLARQPLRDMVRDTSAAQRTVKLPVMSPPPYGLHGPRALGREPDTASDAHREFRVAAQSIDAEAPCASLAHPVSSSPS